MHKYDHTNLGQDAEPEAALAAVRLMDHVLIVGGSQSALDLAARVLLDPGESAWIEDPFYPGARAALVAAGVELEAIPVDADGIQVEHGKSEAADARLIYVTPSHQYPLGVTMSLARRLELLEWARQSNACILEDDYDSEYRYACRPLSPLKRLDSSDRVIYLGTFSKVLFPALRLGYMVVASCLVDAFLAMRYASNRQAPVLEQAVVARELGGFLDVAPAAAGLHLIGWLPDGTDDLALSRAAAEEEVIAAPISRLRLATSGRLGLLLGYAAFDAPCIDEGMRRLADAVHRST